MTLSIVNDRGFSTVWWYSNSQLGIFTNTQFVSGRDGR
jgi:hypothetical protein